MGVSSLEGQVQVFTSVHRHFFTHVLSQALRDAGQGTAVLIVQFFKGGINRGPENPTHLGQNLDWVRCRLPYSINSAPQRAEECAAVRELWAFTQEAVRAERYEQVILEELSLAVFHQIVSEQEVLALLADRPRFMDITLMGQQMPDALSRAANQVTELRNLFDLPPDAAPYPPAAIKPAIEPAIEPAEQTIEPEVEQAVEQAVEPVIVPAAEQTPPAQLPTPTSMQKSFDISPGQISIPGLG